MRKFFLQRGQYRALLMGLLWIGFVPYALSQKVTIGEYIDDVFSTDHPYSKPATQEAKLIQERAFGYPGATYIALHFAAFDLAEGDFVVVRSPDNEQTWVYRGLGRGDQGMAENGFFATHIKGDLAIVEFYARSGGEQGYGFDIDFFGRGYSNEEISDFWARGLGEAMNLPDPVDESRSICTTDDTQEAKCYQTSEPEAYDKSRAVVRLLLNGASHCTGWLIGCDGHVMTNEHCIGSQSQANSIDFEFMAEGSDCSVNCASSLACSGTIEASGSTLVDVNANLDYALVLPDTSTASGTDLPATYGFMRLRDSGPVLNERIYIPQHPAGWGKRIAMESSYPDDTTGFATVNSINENGCSGPDDDIGYWADTQGGSSGSPVLGYSDHRVVALHHCRGSAFCTSGSSSSDDPNRGVPINLVISSLGANLPNCATCDPADVPQGVTAQPGNDNEINITWNSVPGANSFRIYRAFGDCNATNFQLLAENVTGTSFTDNTVSGAATYSYRVASYIDATDCESSRSDCVSATATGVCTIPPAFDGVAEGMNTAQSNCEIQLSWLAASNTCGSGITYNVYRSEQMGFTPGAVNMIASCVSALSYRDQDVESGTTYYYVVRAEDNSGNGSGPCGSGIEEVNTQVVSATPSGPSVVLFEDDMEGGTTNWTAQAGPSDPGTTALWNQVTSMASSPTHSWFVSNEPVLKDQVLQTVNPVTIPNVPGAKLMFQHHFDTEPTWDGGVLEYSTDGTTWLDILDGNADRFEQNGYVSALRTSSNPVNGRQAWHGSNTGFESVEVNLDDFQGQSLYFRWRFGCDTSQAREGWWVDDVRILEPTSCSFTIPEFTLEIWQNGDLFHPGHDLDGNGWIDCRDVALRIVSTAP